MFCSAQDWLKSDKHAGNCFTIHFCIKYQCETLADVFTKIGISNKNTVSCSKIMVSDVRTSLLNTETDTIRFE